MKTLEKAKKQIAIRFSQINKYHKKEKREKTSKCKYQLFN